MTNAALKRAARRAENAELKAKRICIDCYSEHDTGFMRCGPCGDHNRGSPRKYTQDYAARLRELEAIDVSKLQLWPARQLYDAKKYCRRMLAKVNGK